jgi:PRC-barrel domain
MASSAATVLSIIVAMAEPDPASPRYFAATRKCCGARLLDPHFWNGAARSELWEQIHSRVARTGVEIMIRNVAATALLAAAIALPAQAQETKKIDPSNAGPTKAITDQVPAMKGDGTTAAPGATTVPGKAMDQATPGMKPGDTAASSTSAAVGSVMLTDQEAKTWVGKPVYSNDQKKIGEVLAFVRGPDNKVTELRAGIGGLLGFGETNVIVTPSQFSLASDRVNLNLTPEQAKELPKVKAAQ